MLRLVLPKGSLERATLELFAAADLSVGRGSDVDYRASIDDPRIDDVRILRPQEIPRYVSRPGASAEDYALALRQGRVGGPDQDRQVVLGHLWRLPLGRRGVIDDEQQLPAVVACRPSTRS